MNDINDRDINLINDNSKNQNDSFDSNLNYTENLPNDGSLNNGNDIIEEDFYNDRNIINNEKISINSTDDIEELDEEKIENLDNDLKNENLDIDIEFYKLTKELKKTRIINTLLTVFSIFALIVFIAIGVVVFLVLKNNSYYMSSLWKNNVDVSTISQISIKNKIDIQKFANKLAFVDDVINELYYYDKDNKKVEDEMFAGYMNALGDKYAQYFPAKDFEEFTEKTTEGVYYGIGCLVNQNTKTKDCTVSQVYENSPADKGGMQVEDIFVSVDDENVRGININDLVSKIKGPEGTERKIEVFRPSINKNIILYCKCGKVDIKLINTEIYEDNIGYIDIDEFTGKAESQFKAAVDMMVEKNVKALILDCRGNAGGELMTVLGMIDYLIKDKDGRFTLNQKEELFKTGKTLLVYIKERGSIVDSAYAQDNHSVEIPMVVLIDCYTASAAELFSETLRDYKKAELVGIKSFGKGVVQNIIPYDEDGSAIKFTVSEYFPASGYSIDQVGIIPDYSLDYAGAEVFYDDKKRIVEYEDDLTLVFDREGNIIEEIPVIKATNSIATKSELSNNIELDKKDHKENLKIYDDDNEFLNEDWFVELDDKYEDKQLLQAIIVLKDKLNNE